MTESPIPAAAPSTGSGRANVHCGTTAADDGGGCSSVVTGADEYRLKGGWRRMNCDFVLKVKWKWKGREKGRDSKSDREIERKFSGRRKKRRGR